LHYVLFGGSVMAQLAGLHYWFPKFTGRLLDERLGKWSFWTVFLGANLTFFPMHFTGLFGMPRRIYTYSAESGVGDLNLASTVGAFILGFGLLLVLLNVMRSRRNGTVAAADPWDGATLEWSI